MNKVNWRLTRTPRVRAEESKGTNEPECEQKKLRFKRNSKRTEVRTVLFKRCIRVVAHSIPIWHDIMLSVGRSFRSNYSTSSFSSNFPRADSIHSNLKFILHSLHPPPPHPLPHPKCHVLYSVSPFAYVMALIFDDFFHLKRRKTIQGNVTMQNAHIQTQARTKREWARKRERERLVYQVLGFPLPFFCKHSHLCTEKNDLIAPSITKKMFIYTEMIKSNSSVFPSTSSLAHRLSIVPRMSTTLFFAYAQSILGGKIFLSFHWSEVHSKYAQGSG